MNKITASLLSIAALAMVGNVALAQEHEGHFDIAPYLINGELMTGGLDHTGQHTLPPITVYGYEFGEDEFDPFNPSDPGVNQAAGTGNLPAGAKLEYDILSSLLYWNGIGEVDWISPADAVVGLSIGTTTRYLTGTTGPQEGSLVQTITSSGVVHKHFVTSLYANAAASLVPDGQGNVPGSVGYVEPLTGIYAYSINMTLANGANVYTSDPLWVVFNNGLSEEQHEAAVASVPEPTTLGLLSIGSILLMRRIRRS